MTNKGVTFLAKALGVSDKIVPSTFKAKKTAVTAPPKAEDGSEEKAPVVDAAVAAEETPAGMGRGAR